MKPLLIVDSPKRFPLDVPGAETVSAYQYLTDPQFAQGKGRKVFNLCRSLRYQAVGYYVSLLAEARGHRCLPSVAAIQDIRLAPVVRLASDDLEELIQQSLRRIKSDEFELSVYFGHNTAEGHDKLALALFNSFPAPLLRAIRAATGIGGWRPCVIGLAEVPESHREFVVGQAERYLRRAPRKAKEAPPARFDLAILHDPADPMPPSDKKALARFIEAGEQTGIRCELIDKSDSGRIAEYDALFIRETTFVDHHTYRIARRAAEGMVVIDDPQSIVRCTNKVLAETLSRHKLATPRTLVLARDNAVEGLRSLGFPCVLKQPDSSFSAGVSRVDSEDGLDALLDEQFENTDLIVAQEYMPTDFDWRIGVLAGRPLFACRYGMAPGHWQIVKHEGGGKTKAKYGDWQTLAIADAPNDVVKLAVRAAALMGNGLYGVDLKEVAGKPVVIEVNDNPNIDSGVEDQVLGMELYRQIMEHFFWELEAR